jgi:hydroxyacyl-ACP dehydratase HTD2-like protein with hotdog domain
MSSLLSKELLANIGQKDASRRELVSRREIRKYSIATRQRKAKYLSGEEAPPMFHFALFWDMVELDELQPDGCSVDGLLPIFPLKREMAGGLKIEYFKSIRAGDELVATRTLTDIFEKKGSQGPLIFYIVVMEIVDASGDPVLTETTTRILR